MAIPAFNNNIFEENGYKVRTKQEKYELTITADSVISTDESFTMDNITAGDGFKPLDAYFLSADGEIIRRNRARGENKISNMTMPRLAFQLYEKQISALSAEEKENFPVCRYTLQGEVIRGIFPSVERFNAKSGLYFYPEVNGLDSVFLHLNSGSTYENNVTAREDICVIKHGLKIPNNTKNYCNFCSEIKNNEQIFKATVLKLLK